MTFLTINTLKRIATVGILSTSIGGCYSQSSEQNSESIAEIKDISPVEVENKISTATYEEWNRVVDNLFDKINAKKLNDKKNPAYIIDPGESDKNGIVSFFACFDKSPPNCNESASVERDSFRKIQFFSNPRLTFDQYEHRLHGEFGRSSVNGYISLRDCEKPKLIIVPIYRSENWIFMKKFSLMIDGKLAIEREFTSHEVDRENKRIKVEESAHFIADENNINELRKIDKAETVLIRLTGDKRYVGLDLKATKSFSTGITNLLKIYDHLEREITKLGPVKDSQCSA